MRRFDMRLPAIVRLEGTSEFHTETQNVSARGVFFYLDRAVEAGTKLEVTLTFPPHVTLTDAVRVRFSARVIRVEQSSALRPHRHRRHDRRLRIPPLQRQPRLPRRPAEGMESHELKRALGFRRLGFGFRVGSALPAGSLAYAESFGFRE